MCGLPYCFRADRYEKMRLILVLILLLVTLLTRADDETVIASDDVWKSSNLPSESDAQTNIDKPSIYLAIIARNAAHLLPNYLGYIEQLNYPKQQITVG